VATEVFQNTSSMDKTSTMIVPSPNIPEERKKKGRGSHVTLGINPKERPTIFHLRGASTGQAGEEGLRNGHLGVGGKELRSPRPSSFYSSY